ncbi:MAG: DUF3810 family protein [Candidatus Hydrogenedentes bacterium]|nr:DUF3810 family protein [Candidatus Hydrogenedentota bacterium]
MSTVAPSTRWFRRAFWSALGASVSFVVYWFTAPPSPAVVEAYYTKGLYRRIVGLLTPLTERFSFSLAFYLMVGLFVLLPILWAGIWVYLRKRRHAPHWKGLLAGPALLGVTTVVVLTWFVVFWGAGYQRIPVEERLGLDLDLHPQENALLREELLMFISQHLPTPEQRQRDAAVESIAAAMGRIVQDWDGMPIRLPKRVKSAPPGFLLYQGTSGVCAPFTLEANVDGALPDVAFVYVAAHELGHVAGFNTESGASLVGFAAGLQADHPFAQYAVALDLYTDLVNLLPPMQWEHEIHRLPEQALEDLRQVRATFESHVNPWLREKQRVIYEQYLQSQGVEEGLVNYAHGAVLFASAWRKGIIRPACLQAPAEAIVPASLPVFDIGEVPDAA